MALPRLNEGYHLQPRVNVERDEPKARHAARSAINAVTRIFSRASDDDHCKQTANSNTCEKPASVPAAMIAVVVIVPVVLLAGLLLYLHRRNVKRLRLEDVQDPHKSLDFGMDTGTKKSNRKSLFMGGGEKGMHKPSQLSMDMNLSSPYLLPPGLQQSRESLNSLARSLGNDHADPYQQVNHYTNSETGSMRSIPYSSKRMSTLPTRPPRTNSLAKSSLSSPLDDEKIDPFNVPAMPEPAHKVASTVSSPIDSEKDNHHTRSIIPEIGTIADFDEKHDESLVQHPPVARAKSPQFELPAFSETTNSPSGTPMADGFPLPPHRGRDSNNAGLGLNFHLPKGPAAASMDAPASAPLPAQGVKVEEPRLAAVQPEIRTSEYLDDYTVLSQRASFVEDVPPQFQNDQPKGLGVPQTENKRLSVGFRPLPPSDVTESDDPEYRANRIRSFYKEYFEDSSKEAPPPMPAPPAQYYEDYDQGYLGEAAAYFDPESNAFVMPYAAPVTRRAMTPPPSNRRGPPGGGPRAGSAFGPRPRGPHGPHGPHGSLGGMSAPGGPRGRPRAGSAFGPRPDSSASARIRNQTKRLPPPEALTTLPTPSKLKDDDFALLNVIDFAPPSSIRDTAAGRSQSPLGERRAYSPAVPAATPVVSAFEELAALPSPHLLRKSSTFTGLDFAPPKKFKDADNMSDAGSIRSNRSGLSPAGLGAIRNGAGRVSRLPGDTVFTSDSLQDQLKPQWGMRQM